MVARRILLTVIALHLALPGTATAEQPVQDVYEPRPDEWVPGDYSDVVMATDGALSLPVWFSSVTNHTPEHGLPYVSIDVYSLDAYVAGTIRYEPTLGALLWVPNAELPPLQTYTVNWRFQNEQMNADWGGLWADDAVGVFLMTTSAGPRQTLPNWVARQFTVSPRKEIGEICCDPRYQVSCNGGRCESCWQGETDMVKVSLDAELPIDPLSAPFVTVELSLDVLGNISSIGPPSALTAPPRVFYEVDLRHGVKSGRYCVHVESTDVLLDVSRRTDFCETLPEFGPNAPGPFSVDSCKYEPPDGFVPLDPTNPDNCELPNSGDASRRADETLGCHVQSMTAKRQTWPLWGLMVLGLVALRRRRT